jgi:prepilin-type N-terminal cleavage/methylation domain-containing protein
VKKSKNTCKKSRGFTLVELIVVVFIIAALSSIIVLNYPDIVEKAKIKSDIYSAKTIASAIKIYELDKGEKFSGTNNIVEFLSDEGYLEEDSAETPSCGTSWAYDPKNKKVYIEGAAISESVMDSLSKQEKSYFPE